MTPAMEDPIQEKVQAKVEALPLSSPLLEKAESSSPVSVDDDQEWENLGDFQPQDEEELEAGISRVQEKATTPATPILQTWFSLATCRMENYEMRTCHLRKK